MSKNMLADIPLRGILWAGKIPLADTDPPDTPRTWIAATQEINLCVLWSWKVGDPAPKLLDQDPSAMEAIKRAVKLTLKK